MKSGSAMKEMNLKELQVFLDTTSIPKIKKAPKTFLGIAKQPHYENVLSNIYAFYFNVAEEHGMQDLFISSLVEIIRDSKKKEEKDFSDFKRFDIETEYYTEGIGKTKKNGRIDLLLYNENSAIIIENKVHHHLDNDLDDYWKSVKLSSENIKSKIGILLSIKPVSPDKYEVFEYANEFINITHLQLLKRVMKKLGNYYVDADEKYLIFLKDLYQNIINISNYMKKDTLNFYYKNIEVLNDIAKLKFEVRDYIKQEIENTCEVLGKGLVLSKGNTNLEKRLRYYLSPKNSDLMITIIFEELLTPSKTLKIIIDLKNQLLENKAVYAPFIESDDYKDIIDRGFMKNENKVWAHIAEQKYVLEDSEILDIKKFIETKLSSDKFLKLFEELESIVK